MIISDMIQHERQMTKLADQIAEAAHLGQFRYDKTLAYITHPRAVEVLALEIFRANTSKVTPLLLKHFKDSPVIIAEIIIEHIKQVALLHDVVEDTKVALDDLRNYGFHKEVIKAIAAITKNPVKGQEDYLKYLARVINHIYARIVKLADLTHNMSDLKPGNMKDKYVLAEHILSFNSIKPNAYFNVHQGQQ